MLDAYSRGVVPISADVIVVGGGVNGASIAYHLARKKAGRVVLLEKRALASGPTGRSTAIVRRFYGSEFFSRMANSAADIFQNWAHTIGGGDPGFRQIGYVVLADAERAPILERNLLRAREVGSRVQLATVSDLQAIVPRMELDGVALGSYEAESGYADPVATTHALATRAVDLGAIVIQDAPALELVAAGNKMAGVRTPVGVVSAPKVVNCAGPWAATLLAPLGIAVDIQPTRHQMCLFRRPPGFDSHPVIVDTPNRTYMRPDSGHLTAFGVGVYDEVVDPDTYHQGVDASEPVRNAELIARRLPVMKDAVFRGGYSGVYDRTPDRQPVLGRLPQYDGLFACFGWSGHGFKHAPVVGEIIADVVLEGSSKEYDITPFRWSRFQEGDLLPPVTPIAASPV